MKKYFAMLLTVLACISLTACGSSADVSTSPLDRGDDYYDDYYDENQDADDESDWQTQEDSEVSDPGEAPEPEVTVAPSVTIEDARNSIAVFQKMAAAVTKDHKLYVWGKDALDNITYDKTVTGTAIEPTLVAEGVVKIFPDDAGSALVLKEDGSLWGFGDFSKYTSGFENWTIEEWLENSRFLQKIADNVKSATCNGVVAAYVREDGTVVCLESATSCSKSEVENITDVKEIASGYFFVMALKEDGTLWGLGDDRNEILGVDIKAGYQPSYIQIMTDVAAIEVADLACYAIKTDGSLWSWGDNDNPGRLGTGNWAEQRTPVKIMDNVASVSYRGHTVYAVTTDGELYAWGGAGPISAKSNCPQKCADGVAAAESYFYGQLIVKEDGTLYTGGDNIFLQLGYETSEEKTSELRECLTGILLP